MKFKAALTKFGATPPVPLNRENMSSWNEGMNARRASFVHLNASDLATNGLYFGLEMELPFQPERDTYQWYQQPSALNLLNKVYGCLYPFGTCYFDSGIETVTSPATYQAQKRILAYFWNNFNKLDLEMREREHSGNHVHISAAAFKDDAHALRFWRIFNRDRFRDLRVSIAQRPLSIMPSVNDKSVELYAEGDLTQYLRSGRTGATAMNTDHKTHEVRIFRHPTSYLEAAKNLDFVKSAYDFTAAVASVEPTPGEYFEFLAGMDSSYPDLREFWDREKPRASIRVALATAATAETQRLSA